MIPPSWTYTKQIWESPDLYACFRCRRIFSLPDEHKKKPAQSNAPKKGKSNSKHSQCRNSQFFVDHKRCKWANVDLDHEKNSGNFEICPSVWEALFTRARLLIATRVPMVSSQCPTKERPTKKAKTAKISNLITQDEIELIANTLAQFIRHPKETDKRRQ
ncbi:hypothetical protein XU18_1361 [Perkinsela sp. CCAP 1560/4]|nr:hypothetical protein XU18_1361 [Perkinsela sp. CCAP 1560/4]|eukprot:KNH08031.1 hypothetical protein XU18_1361 [Perkinsela sp. CCAP 1560/4]